FIIVAYYLINLNRLRLLIFCIGTALVVGVLIQITFPYDAFKLEPSAEYFVKGYLEEFFRSLILYVAIIKIFRTPVFVLTTSALVYGFLEIMMYNQSFLQGVIHCALPNSGCEGSYFADALKNDVILLALAITKSAIHFLLLFLSYYALRRSIILFALCGPLLHGILNFLIVSAGAGL
ncbi:MAG: hypothetical protein AAFP97_12080, partial [Pseudomonadota bacterium]